MKSIAHRHHHNQPLQLRHRRRRAPPRACAVLFSLIPCALLVLPQTLAFTSPRPYCACDTAVASYQWPATFCLRRNPVPPLQSQVAASLEDGDNTNKDIRHIAKMSSAVSSESSELPSSTTPFVGLPSYRRILRFSATTFLIWVSEPLLSLVDSAAVGRYAGRAASASGSDLSSVVQLAALGPATMLCDNLICKYTQ